MLDNKSLEKWLSLLWLLSVFFFFTYVSFFPLFNYTFATSLLYLIKYILFYYFSLYAVFIKSFLIVSISLFSYPYFYFFQHLFPPFFYFQIHYFRFFVTQRQRFKEKYWSGYIFNPRPNIFLEHKLTNIRTKKFIRSTSQIIFIGILFLIII